MQTAITNAMIADAPCFERLSSESYRRLDGKFLVAHNARFDCRFRRSEFAQVGLRLLAPTEN